ncbi:S1C family serine protease [Candidatus Parcubacteria bacterium]|nr:S1C family serine protease [Candidatus Parcubacteria bacterium]
MRKIIVYTLTLLICINILGSIPAQAQYYADLQAELAARGDVLERTITVSPFEVQDYVGQEALAEKAAEATPAVVSIVDVNGNRVGIGSGFIFTHDGYILTNKHVVASPDSTYTVVLYDGTNVEAEVVYRDSEQDIAVVKIEGTYENSIPLGTLSEIKAGQSVAAIGNVLGLYNNTISVGRVTGFDRAIRASGDDNVVESFEGLIETDAFITPGFSGGPLIDESGRVVGVNVATSLSRGKSYAISIDTVRNRLSQFI